MALFLLDSDAVINYLRGFPRSVTAIRELVLAGDEPCTCDVVVAEVFTGLHAKDQAAAGAFLEAMTFLPTSRAAAQQTGRWRYDFARRGITLALFDTLIAATAHEHGATVVTGNHRHFPMPEIRLLPLPR